MYRVRLQRVDSKQRFGGKMEKILLLGAGMMAKPLVDYFIQRNKYVIVADIDVGAQSEISKEGSGRFEQLDVNDKQKLRELIHESDITISLLPWKLHWLAGKECLDLNKNFVTASYVGSDMKQAASKIEEKGLIFLNEVGLDPGLDHIMILHTIDDVRKKGGKIEELHIYGTSLPSFQDNNNPFHYKFSWSPKGFLLGGLRDASYLENGEEKKVIGEKIFQQYWYKEMKELGIFEVFSNGNANEYIELYDIREVKTLRRNTLRHIDSCEIWENFKRLGLYDDTNYYDFATVTFEQILRKQIGVTEEEPLLEGIADYLGIPYHSSFLKKLEWLEILSKKNIPIGKGTIMDGFCYLLQKKLQYQKDEKDLVILEQEFIVRYENGKRQKITNSLIREGVVLEESATSFLVAIPLAIAADLILRKEIKATGVKIPNEKAVYIPILCELEKNGIKMNQKIEDMSL